MKKAEGTRLNILQKAFALIYEKGYQTTSIDDILATTQVTKGAFYYHFKNKDEMGIAIINELLRPILTSSFIAPLQNDKNPIDTIYNLMHYLLIEDEFLQVQHGCPVANFTQEMASWNKDFNHALNEITQQWVKTMAAVLVKGKEKGQIRDDINAKQVAMFVASGYWGIRNFAKLENDKKVYLSYLKELKRYLNTLK
ncbi:TetR family transcriptional regulator [Chitinophaga polysaccharea]|uniref:TetR family transcriptional regulator n=1 Tax=Chitinophaga polysaccharea TaxID=1293035 RepID=A0A561Q4F5_9BACT|nr:TetR/AcrR family transcriptional regulator [Chitinophaga polysaccharea]TWF45253.1 TetR family transcriptional regulator [Chitinophaga polysaccharea]